MSNYTPEDFYDKISNKYHWFFSSWENIMGQEVSLIQPILDKYNVKTVLDCSCGSGLQAIGLTKNGFTVDGCDISQSMIDKAYDLCRRENFNIVFKKCDFRELESAYNNKFDAVISWGNSIPHMMTEADILKALSSIYSRINDGGIALFDMRNYDVMLEKKKRFHPMRINDVKDDKRYSLLFVFDYLESFIRFNVIYLIEDLKTGEKHMEFESVDYNPIKKNDFVKMLTQVGFKNIVIDENKRDIHYIAEK